MPEQNARTAAATPEKAQLPYSMARMVRGIPDQIGQAIRDPELAERLGDGPLARTLHQVWKADYSEQEWGALLEAHAVISRFKSRDENIEISYRGPAVVGLERGVNLLPIDLWADWSGVPEGHRLLLFSLVRQLRPKVCLELGTAPGYSSLYMAQGLVLNGVGQLHTIEGDEKGHVVGRDTLWLVRDHARFHLGHFAEALEELLPEVCSLDLVFIDGDCTGEEEMEYAARLSGCLNPGAVVVYNGIRWMEDMTEAWESLRKRPEVGVSLDLGSLGIIQTEGAGEACATFHFTARVEGDGFARRRFPVSGVRPANLTWIFGSPRSGTTWLRDMMSEIGDSEVWEEPFVGDLFGSFYYERAQEGQLLAKNFILGEPVRAAWTRGIRRFVQEVSKGRFPGIGDYKQVIVKEPNGSVGAPLLMEALPESRMILLIRDPRDVAASYLDASRKDAWLYNRRSGGWIKESELADRNPDEFVRRIAEEYMLHVGNAGEAYDAHEGPKALVRYEELRSDTLGTMRGLYSELGIAAEEEELARAVEKHAWESIPEREKGEGRFYRKATPGSWREDLTAEQVRIVEEVTASLLERYYPATTGPSGESRPASETARKPTGT